MTTPSFRFANRNLSFSTSGTLMVYAVIALAAGLCLATAALVWFGYIATREWRRGTEALVERRQTEAAALAAGALDRDMKGAAASLLIPLNFTTIEEEPPYDLTQLTARAFARFPYPESLVVWKDVKNPSGTCYALNRAERRPPWNNDPDTDEPFPILVRRDPPPLAGLIQKIVSQYVPTRSFAAIETTLAGVPYQVIVHYLADPHVSSRLPAFVAFTVNLNWVRSDYFPPVLLQTATIGGDADVVSFSVTDDHNVTVAATGRPRQDYMDVERRFPLLFIDRVLLSSNPTQPHDWTVHVRSSRDNAAAVALEGAQRTFFLIALSAIVTVAALLVTIRAVEARAALATMKSDFVSAVTHELKTPLALIRLVGDTLAAGRYTSPSAVQEYAQMLSQEATRLSRSIDQLLTYARYSSSQKREGFTFSAQDVADLIDRGVEQLGPALTDANFDVEIDVPKDLPPIRADAPAIAQVFENVIDNAIKYVGSTALLRISARANGKFVKITFADSGIGIPSEDLDHVFDRFYRGRNANTSGSGLGLAIAKRIVEMHRGDISVQSTVNVGTEVELRLPIGTG